MNTGLFRACVLICVVLYVAWRWYLRLNPQYGAGQHAPTEHYTHVLRRRRWYRAGVLAGCLLALGSYYVQLPRVVAMGLLVCAAVFQYKAWRASTAHFFKPAPPHDQTGTEHGSGDSTAPEVKYMPEAAATCSHEAGQPHAPKTNTSVLV